MREKSGTINKPKGVTMSGIPRTGKTPDKQFSKTMKSVQSQSPSFAMSTRKIEDSIGSKNIKISSNIKHNVTTSEVDFENFAKVGRSNPIIELVDEKEKLLFESNYANEMAALMGFDKHGPLPVSEKGNNTNKARSGRHTDLGVYRNDQSPSRTNKVPLFPKNPAMSARNTLIGIGKSNRSEKTVTYLPILPKTSTQGTGNQSSGIENINDKGLEDKEKSPFVPKKKVSMVELPLKNSNCGLQKYIQHAKERPTQNEDTYSENMNADSNRRESSPNGKNKTNESSWNERQSSNPTSSAKFGTTSLSQLRRKSPINERSGKAKIFNLLADTDSTNKPMIRSTAKTLPIASSNVYEAKSVYEKNTPEKIGSIDIPDKLQSKSVILSAKKKSDESGVSSPRSNNKISSPSPARNKSVSTPFPEKIDGLYQSPGRRNSMTNNSAQSPGSLQVKGAILFFDWLEKASTKVPLVPPAKVEEESSKWITGVGSNSHMGKARDYNEDEISISMSQKLLESQKLKNFTTQSLSTFGIFSIFDGHGGAECSKFLKVNLHPHLIEKAFKSKSDFNQKVKSVFTRLELAFRDKCEELNLDYSGSCSISLIVVNSTLITVNVGDSRCILSADGGREVTALTKDHKPELESEFKRVVKIGGKIYRTLFNKYNKGFVDEIAENFTDIKTFEAASKSKHEVEAGPWRVYPGNLSVSRTVGDFECKLENLGGVPGIVINEPEITETEIGNSDFAVIGCKLIR